MAIFRHPNATPPRHWRIFILSFPNYLRHREEIEAYLDANEQHAEEVRQRIERHQGDLSDLRQRLRARHQGS